MPANYAIAHLNNTKPWGRQKRRSATCDRLAAPGQLCSDIAKDGRFALSCCEQRQQRDSASRHRGNGVELAVATDAMKAYETLEEDNRDCLAGSHAQ